MCNMAVLTAPPGAGKSTVLPLMLLKEMEGRIIMLEPRRIAARHIAERMAKTLGEQVGETVGYRVRFESKVGPKTRIEVITEGILTRMLLEDPALENADLVIFDEFHERSIITDEALALIRQTRQILRPDLRVLIMSATIDAEAICRDLGCELIQIEGRNYPVEIRYSEKAVAPGPELAREVAAAVSRMSRERAGDILAFLPGEADIRRCADLLNPHFSNVYPLYGNLPHEEQRKAIEPSVERKIILATPVAETSLTIEGVSIVIDAGYFKRPVFDPRSELSHLETFRISRDMADQRAGRSGRTQSGLCLRLWPENERLQSIRTPEIVGADLVPLALDAAVWGSSDIPWLTPPDPSAMGRARKTLTALGALSDEGKITAKGRAISRFPCHPRIANMLLSHPGRVSAQVAAILEDRDPCPGGDADIRNRLDKADRKAVEQYLRLCSRVAACAGEEKMSPMPPADDPGVVIASAYPERVGKSIGAGWYLLSGGEKARLDHRDELAGYEWIAAAAVEGGWIRLAAPVDPYSLPLRERRSAGWDPREKKVFARREKVFGKLVVESHPESVGNATEILVEAAKDYGREMFDFASVENLQNRIAAASAWHPELEFPSFRTEDLMERAADWVPFAASRALDSGASSSLRTTAAELRKADLGAALLSILSYEQLRALDSIAPEFVTVPTGSRIRLEYRSGADAPVLRVRLQECFGLTDTPKVDYGRRPVLMELLSPGFKPVQLTTDLRSFWTGTYFEVRKELSRRYPRHSWPDNPLDATPVRGVRKSR